MRRSISRLLSFTPEAMYLTHYGRVPNVSQRASDLLRHLDVLVAMALSEKDAGAERQQCIKQAMAVYLFEQIRGHGCKLPEAELIDIWETDLELNAQGLCVWLDSRKA
jgi:hypothetical protein